MIKGYVNKYDEPLIKVSIHLRKRTQVFNAVIDTGFNGYLSVPANIIDKTDWIYSGFEEYELASGEFLNADVFIGTITMGNEKNIPVYALSNHSKDILIGTKLLKNKFLGINFKTNVVEVYETE